MKWARAGSRNLFIFNFNETTQSTPRRGALKNDECFRVHRSVLKYLQNIANQWHTISPWRSSQGILSHNSVLIDTHAVWKLVLKLDLLKGLSKIAIENFQNRTVRTNWIYYPVVLIVYAVSLETECKDQSNTLLITRAVTVWYDRIGCFETQDEQMNSELCKITQTRNVLNWKSKAMHIEPALRD